MQWFYEATEIRSKDQEKAPELWDLTIIEILVTIAFPIGGIIGGVLIWPCATILGRKLSLFCSNGVVIFALVLLSFSRNSNLFEVLVLGRMLIGVCAGLNSGIAPIYLVEISPYCLRGMAASAYYVAVATSIFFSYFLTYPYVMGSDELWGFIFMVSAVPIIIQVSFC